MSLKNSHLLNFITMAQLKIKDKELDSLFQKVLPPEEFGEDSNVEELYNRIIDLEKRSWQSIENLPQAVNEEPQIVEVLIDNTEISEAYYDENTWWIKLPSPAVGWQDYRTFDTDFEITNWRNCECI